MALDLGADNDSYKVDWKTNTDSQKVMGYGWGGSGIVTNEGGDDTYNCFADNCFGVGWLATGGSAPTLGEGIFIDAGAGTDAYCVQASTFNAYFSTASYNNKPGRGSPQSLWVGEHDPILGDTLFGVGLDDGKPGTGAKWTSGSSHVCVK